MLGVAVITYNRLPLLKQTLDAIKSLTDEEIYLVVSDDGSTDGTVEYCQENNFRILSGQNRGMAWNYNKALYNLSRNSDCYILVEDDAMPNCLGWQREWKIATGIWNHINYGYNTADVRGIGTAQDPYWSWGFGTQCNATSKDGLESVGYMDPRFYETKYTIAHAEWTFRFERWYGWQKHNGLSTVPCLRSGIHITFGVTYSNPEQLEASKKIQNKIGVNEPIYRLPWRNKAEKHDFLISCQ